LPDTAYVAGHDVTVDSVPLVSMVYPGVW